jgi:hypothetical protein
VDHQTPIELASLEILIQSLRDLPVYAKDGHNEIV